MQTYTQRVTTCLHPQSEALPCGTVRHTIFWRSGCHSQGTLQVTLPASLADGAIVAELAALQYLLEEAAVAGQTQTGKGLLLVVSQGAIRKLMADRSTKDHLYPWACFLNTRFQGARCLVDADCSWVGPSTSKQVHALTAKAPQKSTITFPQLGKVSVSKHAMNWLAKHLNYPTKDALWLSLTRIVASKSLIRLPDDRFKSARDQSQHGKAGMRFHDPKTKWVLVVVHDSRQLVLVTMYLNVRGLYHDATALPSRAQSGRPDQLSPPLR